MNTIRKKLADFTTAGRQWVSDRIKLAACLVAVLAGVTAQADPAGTFSDPIPIGSAWGSVTVDNSTAVASPQDPLIAGNAPFAPVWFQFTATNDGEVTIDTIGSLDLFGAQMDTVVSVFAGTNQSSLYQVAANNDLYPNNPLQFNYANQNIYQADPLLGAITSSQLYPYFQPFVGPSALRFNAKKDVTYYIAADTLFGIGEIALNWAYHSSGAFRFASENVDQTGITDSAGNPVLLYQCATTEGSVLVTVTRSAGYTGRMTVDFKTVDGDPAMLLNGDLPAVAGTDFLAVSNTLTFDDFEMSKTVSIPIISFGAGAADGNHDFTVVLSNPQRDVDESDKVSAPRLDPVFYQALVRILSPQISPFGQMPNPNTNSPILFVTADAFNFGRANYRLQRPFTTNSTFTYLLSISRTGVNNNATNIYYQVNSGYPFIVTDPFQFAPLQNMRFPLMPGSDYATPDPAGSGNVFGSNPDFTVENGTYSGTISWGDKDKSTKTLAVTLYNNGQVNFNEDFQIELYARNANGQVMGGDVGMIGETTVTLVFQDQNPPAGSVDEKNNPDYNQDLVNMQVGDDNREHPGTDGQVYGVAVQSDDKTVIVGDFYTYNGDPRCCIARINADGLLDDSFNPGTGVDKPSDYDGIPPIFINAVALDTTNNRVLIAGSFHSYNGSDRGNVARLNSNGTLDDTFNSSVGANGPVYAIYLQGDGKIMIGGDFSSYDGYPAKNLARLNTDGSLDQSFNPGTALNAPVYALAEQNGTFIDASRSASGTELEDINTVNVGAASGTLTIDYDMLFVPDDLRVFYGDTNGVLIYDTGLVSGTGHLVIPFGPTNGLTFNSVTIVMNQGNGVPGTFWSYTASVQSSFANQLYVGGEFTAAGGFLNQDHIARFLGDGSLDTTFDPDAGINGPVYALAVQQNGLVLAGGEFSQVNALNYNRLIRLLNSGMVDPDFQNGIGVDGTVFSIDARNDGTIYVGGAFTSVNGTHRLGFARLNSDGTVDTSFLDTAYNQFAGLPRQRFSDPVGTVYASDVQSNGGVMIGGSFDQVGGGQFNAKVRPESSLGAYATSFTRDGIRNRSNIARLVGGGTPGPGNVGLLKDSYSVNKSASSLSVRLLRANGSLGIATANFSVQPGLAQSGSDFSYSSPPPAYPWLWENSGYPFYSRMHSDGLFGTNTFVSDTFGNFYNATAWAPSSLVTVSVINNSISSGDLNAQFQLANPANSDQFFLGGQNIPLGVALGGSTAPLTIVDDQHKSGVVGFAASSYVGSGTSSAVGVVRTNGNYGKISVHFTTITNGSTAVAGSDYTPRSLTVNLQNGDSSNSVNITILKTNYVTSVEKFVNLQLDTLEAPPNGIATLGRTNAVLRIINPNFAGYLNFSTNNYYVNLSSGVAYIPVTRTVGSKGTLTVQVVTTNGTAFNGVNYVGSTNSLQWNNGDVSSRIVAVPLINNSSLGGSLTFAVNLLNPALNGTNTASLLGLTPSATVTINNDNSYGVVQFSTSDYVVNENGGYATLTVTRTGSSFGPATVDYATIPNTAVAGVNYTSSSGTLIFAPGQIAKQIQVPILNDGMGDNLDPASFYFQVQLSSPGAGVTLGTPNLAQVHIVEIAYDRPPGSEDDTFNASTGINGPVFALAQQSSGQLIVGGSFTIANGSVRNNFVRLNTDGTTDVMGFLYGLAGANSAVYTLANQTDDRIILGGSFVTVDGVARKHIARVLTDGSLDTSFNPGTGADGTVYSVAETFVGGTRKIYAAGDFQNINSVGRPFLARLNNNGSVDTAFNPGFGPNDTVYAVAAYPTNSLLAGKVLVGGLFTNVNNFAASYFARLNVDGSVDTNFDGSVGVNGTVRAIAIQNDGGILVGGDFTSAFDSLNGTTTAAHLVRIYETNGLGRVDTGFASALGGGPNGRVNAISLQADNRIVVAGEFSQAGGVARNNITRLMPDGSMDPTINFGSGANASVYATLVQAADQMLVLGGAFTQYDGQPHNRIVRVYGGSQTGAGALEFTSSGYEVAENGVNALITIRRTGGTTGTATVDFATSPLTAVVGVNYNSVSQTVSFPSGEVLKTVAVPVLDDGVITPDLTVNLTLSNPSNGAGFGDQTNAVLTIKNVESVVAFGSPNYAVSRNVLTGRADIEVVRLGTTNVISTVDFLTTTNGTAVAGTDFYPTNLTLTFNLGESSKVVQIGIITNALPQPDLTVVFALSNAVNTAISDPSNTTLTIRGTNGPGVIGFPTNSFVANEGDGNAYLTVTRNNGAAGIVSVNFTTIAGSAVAGVNYQTTSGTVTFGDGETNGTITVPLVDNNFVQGPVAFTVRLSGVAGGATLSTATNATVSILDNDAGIAFAAATNNAPEDSGFANVVVLRLYNTNGTASVHYTTVDGTAFANVNYTPISGTLIFTNGETLKSLSIPVINNSLATGDLMFDVKLSSPVSAQLVAPSNTVVVIQDADAGITFTNPSMTVLKSIGLATITVVCSNPRVEPVIVTTNDIPLQVNYATADGTAFAGIDYQSVSGTLVFTNGVATNTFTVPIYNNGYVTGDRAFTVVLSDPTPPGQITPYGTLTVTIAESNAGLQFSQGNYKAYENGITASINVLRTGFTNSTVSVNYLATNGTAIGGVNFVPTGGTLVFTNGVVSQNFNVALIANPAVQPNLTVQMNLSKPTNGLLATPNAATLTILETGGSYVIPAGAQMVTNYTTHVSDGIIGSNDAVQVLFALRDAAGLDVTNLTAFLLATNGVISPSPASQNYGNLKVYGHSVSRAFTFTAQGTNSQSLKPTFALYSPTTSPGNFIGTAVFNYSVGTWATTFANTNAIIINDNTNASPYPSVISVSGLGTSLVKATVTLTNLTHTSPADIDALVVSPSQKNTLIMAHAGAQFAVSKITVKLDDAATNSLPQASVITNGVYKPTGYLPVRRFP